MKELIIVALLGIAMLAIDILKLRKLALAVGALGLLSLIGVSAADWGTNQVPFAEYGGMLLFDNYALAFTIAFAAITLLWLFLTSDTYGTNHHRRIDIYALSFFSLCGAVLMVSYSNLVMLFIGLEILSIPLYALAASNKRDLLSNEAGFKYFFLGSVASAVLLFGIALIYGACGSFDLHVIHEKIEAMNSFGGLITTGVVLILVGFAFKISVAPFQMWAPDVYQGSPSVVTAFMATIVKGAAFGGMVRLFGTSLFPLPDHYITALAWMSALTLIFSNLVAMKQVNSKRLLAYSSVSHAGFMLGLVMMASSVSPKYLLYYIITYSVASLTAFAVINHVSSIQNGDESIDAFKGLVKRNPLLAGAMTLSLLSMAGIPPLSGFLAKYFVISNLLAGGYVPLVIVMILTSAVAAYYYLKIIIAMFTPLENAGRIYVDGTQKVMYIILSILMVAMFFGAGLLEMIKW
jgi:NADH-quinone oxidoreductase subunit N